MLPACQQFAVLPAEPGQFIKTLHIDHPSGIGPGIAPHPPRVLSLIATGTVMEFVLPPRCRSRSLWTMDRHGWGEMHFWLAVGICALVLLHLVMRWQWVCTITKSFFNGGTHGGESSRRSTRVIAGSACLLLVVAGCWTFIAVARAKVVQGSRLASHEEGDGARSSNASKDDRLRYGRNRRD